MSEAKPHAGDTLGQIQYRIARLEARLVRIDQVKARTSNKDALKKLDEEEVFRISELEYLSNKVGLLA